MLAAEDVRDGEIVGLHSSTFGRSYDKHAVCGQELEVGSIVHFKLEQVAK